MCFLALVLLVTKVRGRAERVKHGMDSEPAILFMVKNLVKGFIVNANSTQTRVFEASAIRTILGLP